MIKTTVVIVICLILLLVLSRESFSNKSIKIYDYYNKTPNVNYKQYISVIPESDIVEYEMTKKLYNDKELTLANLDKI